MSRGFPSPEPIIWISGDDYFRKILSDIGYQRATQKQLLEFESCVQSGPSYRRQVKAHLESMRLYMYHDQAAIIEQEYLYAIGGVRHTPPPSEAGGRRSSVGQRTPSSSSLAPRRYSMGQRPLAPLNESRDLTPPQSVTGMQTVHNYPMTPRMSGVGERPRRSGVGERPPWFVPTVVNNSPPRQASTRLTASNLQTYRGSIPGTPPDSRSGGSRRNGDITETSGGKRSGKGGKRNRRNSKNDKEKAKACCCFG